MAGSIALPPVGEWLSRSFVLLRRRWLPFTLLGLLGAAVTGLAVALVGLVAVGVLGVVHGREALSRLTEPRLLDAALHDPGVHLLVRALQLAALLVALRVGAWFALAIVHATCGGEGLRASLRHAKARALGFLVVALLQQAVTAAGLAALVVPGVALGVLLTFAPLAHARGGFGILESFGVSARLVRGRFLAVLGRLLLLGLVAGAIALVPLVGWVLAPGLALVAWGELYRDAGGPVGGRR